MMERMNRIASKGLALDASQKDILEMTIKSVEEIDFNQEQGWTLAKDYSQKNILNLSTMNGINRRSSRKLSLGLQQPPET